MSGVMKEVQVLLYKAKQNGNNALGEDEIFPVAFLAKERTKNKLFANAHFGIGYSGIISPEIQHVLGLFRKNVSTFIKLHPVPDIYFQITQIGEEKTKPFIKELRKEGTEWEKIVEEILSDLEKDRKKVIQEAMEEIREM